MEEYSKHAPLAYSMTVQQIVDKLGSNTNTGLTNEQAQQRLNAFGLNELSKKEQESLFSKIKEQFEDILVRILLVSAVVSLILAIIDKTSEEGIAAYLEPIVIFLILILNATVGVLQDLKAEKALESLKQLQSSVAYVIRNGDHKQVSALTLVIGDIVKIQIGEKIPADLRLISIDGKSLQTRESNLTGEPHDIEKYPDAIPVEKTQITDKTNCLFSSTIITSGSGLGIVIATGANTELGKIHSGVKQAQEEKELTPLQKELEEFGKLLSKIIGCICAVVWLANIHNFFDPAHGSPLKGAMFYFKMAIALAVAAIPEGLPAVITTCLALGTIKMAARNAIVTKLSSVETLGCTTVICSDKTGTLTKSTMEAKKIMVMSNSTPHVIEIASIKECNNVLKLSAEIAVLCNQSKIKKTEKGYEKIGAATETALLEAGEIIGNHILEKAKDELYYNYIRTQVQSLGLFEFERNRKASSVIVRKSGQSMLYTIGGAEVILNNCKYFIQEDNSVLEISPSIRKEIEKVLLGYQKEAMRCIAVQFKKDNIGKITSVTDKESAAEIVKDEANYSQLEADGILVGIYAIHDPLREEVPNSIALCKKAGIEVIMITGDNKSTAFAIAQEANICHEESFVIEGGTFQEYSDKDKIKFLQQKGGKVFARVAPMHKQEIVKQLKKMNHVVAMTGDGVNDAPALQQADIGIAMGITGSNVAREASKLILNDDNFATIVAAVEMGRSIYDNMKSFIRYLISSNIGEVVAIFSTAILCIPESLSSVQLLWVNLVTDGLPATALGFNPPEKGIMEKPPRKPNANLIDRWTLIRYSIIGGYIGFATVGIFVYWYLFANTGDGHPLVRWIELSNWSECLSWPDYLNGKMDYSFAGNNFKGTLACDYFITGKIIPATMSLSVLVLIEMLNALNAISENGSLLSNPPYKNKWLILAVIGSLLAHAAILYIAPLSNVFSLAPIGFAEWKLVLLFSLPVIFIDEILKHISRKRIAKELEEKAKQD